MTKIALHLDRFARHILGRPLYPYQLEVAAAILESVLGGYGRIFTVMMARQSGKNQISAVVEAYLLMTRRQGTIVKVAPTFTPQIINSRLRLLSMLDTPLTRKRIWTNQGYIVGLAPGSDSASLRTRSGPRIMFYSASAESNVVGATADLLLEIDEAQDVDPARFDRDFRPMASTSNATTVLYGTAWSDSTLLARQRATNLALERRTGTRLHFEHNWMTLGAINPAYRVFVEQEIARLGDEHPAIQTQYWLRPLEEAGYLLNSLQQTMLQGEHSWEERPRPNSWYIASMDVASDAHLSATSSQKSGSAQRDSSVVTVGRICYNTMNLPSLEVVHQEWWTGMAYLDQYTAVLELVERWGIRALVIDSTGLGAGLASLLLTRLGTERVQPFTFSRPSKSRLAYQLLSFINSGRLKLYRADTAPAKLAAECWQQLRAARYRLVPTDNLDIYVDQAVGHDDFLISLALLLDGLEHITSPAASLLVQPVQLYKDEGHF
jgi:hypothetical protein